MKKNNGSGWFNESRRHSLASKGVKSVPPKISGMLARGLPETFSLDYDTWELTRRGKDDFKLRLGNWTWVGWHWSGDESDFMGYLIRLNDSKVKKEFLDALKENNISFDDLKDYILASAEDGSGVYMITGDNRKWHFGEGMEDYEYDIIDNDLPENFDVTKEILEEFKNQYSWSAGAYDFDEFEKSHHYKDLKNALVDAVKQSSDWSGLMDRLSDAGDWGHEASWEWSADMKYANVHKEFKEFLEEREAEMKERGLHTGPDQCAICGTRVVERKKGGPDVRRDESGLKCFEHIGVEPEKDRYE